MKKTKIVGASIARPHIEETAEYNREAVTLKSAQKERGITLIALIITIIIMLILVTVSIQIALNTGLFDAAGKATQKWDIAQDAEQELANGDIVNKYVSQATCNHEWGEWEENEEKAEKTRTCTKCGTKENALIIKIGAYIEGYNPAIGKSGDIETTSYESKGAQTGGTNIDGTSGNGYGNQEFSFTKEGFTTTEEEKATGKTKWRIIGEENGQIIITTADPIQTTGGSNYYLQGQAGYANFIEELNKISGIYGQGKYADTSKYSYEIDGTTIESGGRSLKVEDIEYTLTEATKIYTTNAEGNILKDNGTVGLNFTYWGEDDTNLETGAEWFTLGAEKSTTMIKKTLSGGNTEIRSIVGQDSEGKSVYSWLASRYVEFESGRVRFDVRIISSSEINSFRMFYSCNITRGNSYGVRPVVYLKPGIQLSYNSETGVYTIIP